MGIHGTVEDKHGRAIAPENALAFIDPVQWSYCPVTGQLLIARAQYRSGH
jgi:hypothetical protein